MNRAQRYYVLGALIVMPLILHFANYEYGISEHVSKTNVERSGGEESRRRAANAARAKARKGYRGLPWTPLFTWTSEEDEFSDEVRDLEAQIASGKGLEVDLAENRLGLVRRYQEHEKVVRRVYRARGTSDSAQIWGIWLPVGLLSFAVFLVLGWKSMQTSDPDVTAK